ncbi:Hypothetical predicted protein [Xyrichtys novacula]|uniref:Uncharacterized protein n=1 Tax=Xyrichtys novacula TaxID=13765 RepID=A0AAV1HPY2_XYRNO|nr:Hypothetical predicted protein [Xyrichtys novacula]
MWQRSRPLQALPIPLKATSSAAQAVLFQQDLRQPLTHVGTWSSFPPLTWKWLVDQASYEKKQNITMTQKPDNNSTGGFVGNTRAALGLIKKSSQVNNKQEIAQVLSPFVPDCDGGVVGDTGARM